MEHNCTNPRAVMPMSFIGDRKEKTVDFVTDDLVMEGDTLTAVLCDGRLTGTIKEVLEERPAKGNYENLGHTPTFYKVKLY